MSVNGNPIIFLCVLNFSFIQNVVLSFEFADNHLTEGAALLVLFDLDIKIYSTVFVNE